jgi:hypothetical protein
LATSYLLLMRHGAGIKAGHDPTTNPPGPDQVLTAQGFRDAQAVGQRLAETLATADDGRPVKVAEIRYAGGAKQTEGWDFDSKIDREPKATAKMVVRQLKLGGVEYVKPVPWEQIGSEEFPASSENAADKACKAAKVLREAAKKHCAQAILVIGNSPQVDWIAEQFVGRPIAVGRGEVVCLTGPRRRWRWSRRPCDRCGTWSGPSDRARRRRSKTCGIRFVPRWTRLSSLGRSSLRSCLLCSGNGWTR